MPSIWGVAAQIVGRHNSFFAGESIARALNAGIAVMQVNQVIYIHVEAPAKPEEGAPCNGCGVCCLTQPCPLGILLSGTRKGACTAVRWRDDSSRYICGALGEPYAVVKRRLPKGLGWMAKPLAAVLPRLAHRWIAAGMGCDSNLLPLAAGPAPLDDNPPSPSLSHPKSVLPND